MKRHRQHRGFSLLELLLVLALLVMIAAVAAPSLTNTLRYRTLKESADLVRGEFSKTRARAMQSGEEYVFSYIPGTGNYTVRPYEIDVQPDLTSEQQATGNYDYGRGLLPDKVVFAEMDVALDTRQLELEQEVESQLSLNSDTQQILFYPDGSTQSAKIQLRSESNETVGIELRGLTGVSSIVESNEANP